MSEKKPRVSRIDGAAFVDLRVYQEHKDTDLWALMAVINVHDWRANRGDLLYDFIAQETGWSIGKIGMVVARAEKAGLITTENSGHGKIIEKAVAPMGWDEFHALQKKTPDTQNLNIGDSKNGYQEPKKSIPEVQKLDLPNIDNALQRPFNAADAAAAKGKPPEAPKKMPIENLQESEFGKAFIKKIYEKLRLPYEITFSDAKAYAAFKAVSPRPDSDLISCLDRFLDPAGYPSKRGAISIHFFFREVVGYLAGSGPKSDRAMHEEKARYYEPWDPRHPNYREGDLVQAQMKQNHEAVHGKWGPKPDWKPEGV